MKNHELPQPQKKTFKLKSTFKPTGDQPEAIARILESLSAGERNTLLQGVTGSGKTFTMANVIAKMQKTTLLLAPNKILAAQLYQEMREFFPDNAVEYFVSYYDYYLPEAYIPKNNLYIAKESSVNSYLDRLRNSATRSLMERTDTIIVASVSCIYGMGRKEDYQTLVIKLAIGDRANQKDIIAQLTTMSYKRSYMRFMRGFFRVRGRYVEVFPSHLEQEAWRITLEGTTVGAIHSFEPISGKTIKSLAYLSLYPNTHYAATVITTKNAIKHMRKDLDEECRNFIELGKTYEASRLRERTELDIEMLDNTGSCEGIENYSRYFTQRAPGSPPPTLLEYMPKNALFIVDESHLAIPQLHAMFQGDRARKNSLVEHGFRLAACRDNRPLTFSEWDTIRPQTLFVSATPGPWEMRQSTHAIQQIIRPTGLLDPQCVLRPSEGQVYDLMHEARERKKRQERVLVTTLTKKSAELLSEFFVEHNMPSRYMHSNVDTLERTVIIQDFREGVFDVLVGINLLREGLDLPECSLVAIFDADKAGYLRSKTSLIQTIGRAARHVNGMCILYTDKPHLENQPVPLQEAVTEIEERRALQMRYNTRHNIIPTSITKPV